MEQLHQLLPEAGGPRFFFHSGRRFGFLNGRGLDDELDSLHIGVFGGGEGDGRSIIPGDGGDHVIDGVLGLGIHVIGLVIEFLGTVAEFVGAVTEFGDAIPQVCGAFFQVLGAGEQGVASFGELLCAVGHLRVAGGQGGGTGGVGLDAGDLIQSSVQAVDLGGNGGSGVAVGGHQGVGIGTVLLQKRRISFVGSRRSVTD